MGTSRVSNKDVLDAINALTAAITANVVSPAKPAISVADGGSQEKFVEIDPAYQAHMKKAKAQPFANAHGTDVVLYARKNGRGETKLAYCLAEKFASIKDRGLLGAIEVISPAS